MNLFDEFEPKSITQFIADTSHELSTLDLIVRNVIEFPNNGKCAILLHGQYGAGKTKLAKMLPALIEEHRAQDFDNNSFRDIGVTFVSCSATGGSKIASEAMPTQVSFHQSGFHYIILDEVDNLRIDAQKNMKSFITEYSHVIYIMTTNHLSKIDGGLVSRAHCVSFENPCPSLWKQRCMEILKEYSVSINEEFIDITVKNGKGDARYILNEVQRYILTEGS